MPSLHLLTVLFTSVPETPIPNLEFLLVFHKHIFYARKIAFSIICQQF